jgi:hypothetical protein
VLCAVVVVVVEKGCTRRVRTLGKCEPMMDQVLCSGIRIIVAVLLMMVVVVMEVVEVLDFVEVVVNVAVMVVVMMMVVVVVQQ